MTTLHKSLTNGKSISEQMAERRKARYRNGDEKKEWKKVEYKVDPVKEKIKNGCIETACKLYFHFLQKILGNEKAIWQKENTEVIVKMVSHFSGIETKDRGFYLGGHHGVGKTTHIRALLRLHGHLNNSVAYTQDSRDKRAYKALFVQYSKLFEDYKKYGLDDFKQRINGYSQIVINDFGFLNNTTEKVFGNDKDIASILVDTIYDEWQIRGKVFHFTSNRNQDTLKKILPQGIYDRLNEMSEYLVWKGKNLRQ